MPEEKKELLDDVRVTLTVELGKTKRTVREALNLAPGSIVGLNKLRNEFVDVYVNKVLFARGEVVTIDENFGVRVTEVIDKERRYTSLQRTTR